MATNKSKQFSSFSYNKKARVSAKLNHQIAKMTKKHKYQEIISRVSIAKTQMPFVWHYTQEETSPDKKIILTKTISTESDAKKIVFDTSLGRFSYWGISKYNGDDSFQYRINNDVNNGTLSIIMNTPDVYASYREDFTYYSALMEIV